MGTCLLQLLEKLPDVRASKSAGPFCPLTGDQHPRFRKTWAPDTANVLRNLLFPLFFSVAVILYFLEIPAVEKHTFYQQCWQFQHKLVDEKAGFKIWIELDVNFVPQFTSCGTLS